MAAATKEKQQRDHQGELDVAKAGRMITSSRAASPLMGVPPGREE